MELHPVGAEVLHEEKNMERLTDMTNLIVTLCNFVNAPKIKIHSAKSPKACY
jgi:predicted house-cleaning noncanonical NTP pyrophosphatase (MazG superfamily)